MNLRSYVRGKWLAGRDRGVAMREATTGEIVAQASCAGIDFSAVRRCVYVLTMVSIHDLPDLHGLSP